MTEQLLTTIITVMGTIFVALATGFATWAVATRQDRTQRIKAANEKKQQEQEQEQERAAAVRAAQQQIVDNSLGFLVPYKEQNDWLIRQVQELTSRVDQLEDQLREKIVKETQLLRENADLRAAYNAMSRKVQKLERFIRANIGRDIDTDDLDSSPELETFADARRAADDTPPIPNKSPFADPPPPDSDDPKDWQ